MRLPYDSRIVDDVPFNWGEMVKYGVIPSEAIRSNITELIKMVGPFRNKFGRPWRVNSGYRTPEHNASVGGVKNSQHTFGKAMDITRASFTQAQIKELWKDWPGGMGVYGWGVHLDSRTRKYRWGRRP